MIAQIERAIAALVRDASATGTPGYAFATVASYDEAAVAIAGGVLKRWPAFTRFLDDGRICLSNNAAERALRGIAVGRRNWTFAGSDEGGRRAAALYTLIETAKLNAIDPRAWLADVIARLPATRPAASTNSRRGTGRTQSRSAPPRNPAHADNDPSSRFSRGRHRLLTRSRPLRMAQASPLT